MPLWDYECTACGYRFDELQDLDAKPLKTCPKGKKRKLEKLVSAPSIICTGLPSGRIREIDERKQRQKNRIDRMISKGELTTDQAWAMSSLAKKRGRHSPYLTEPRKELKRSPPPDHEIDYKSSAPPKEPKFYGFDSRKNRTRQKRGK